MHNSGTTIFLPVLAQIAMTMGLYIYLGVAKARALKIGKVDLERRALHADAWPDDVQQINNSIRNQFELPVLFIALVLVLFVIDAAGPLAHVLAWAFVLGRVLHAYVHTGSNHVPHRRALFSFGCIVVLLMLVLAAIALV